MHSWQKRGMNSQPVGRGIVGHVGTVSLSHFADRAKDFFLG